MSKSTNKQDEYAKELSKIGVFVLAVEYISIAAFNPVMFLNKYKIVLL